MSTEPVLAIAAATTSSSEAPLTYYETMNTGAGGLSEHWQGIMSDVGKVAERFRTQLDALNNAEPVGAATSTETFQTELAAVCRLSYSSMNVSLVTSAERLLSENVRTLYQLA